MSVTYDRVIRRDELSAVLEFHSSVTPPVPFRVYKEGLLVGSFDSLDGNGAYTVSVMPGEWPFIEVLDKACQNPAIAFPGRATLNWLAVSDAVSYLVQENVATVWTDRQFLPSHGGGAYVWTSRWLEDITSHQFRVYATDAAGNQSSALGFTFLMVRHPDGPNVSYAVNVGRTLTISAA